MCTARRERTNDWKGHGSIASLTGLERQERGGGHGNGKKAISNEGDSVAYEERMMFMSGFPVHRMPTLVRSSNDIIELLKGPDNSGL